VYFVNRFESRSRSEHILIFSLSNWEIRPTFREKRERREVKNLTKEELSDRLLGFDTQAVGLSRNVSKPTQPKSLVLSRCSLRFPMKKFATD